MKCIVHLCNNELTEFEINKINPKKFSKFRLCKYCRMYNKNEMYVCECGTPFQGGGLSLYCDACKQARKDYYNNHRPKPTKEQRKIYNKRHYEKHGPRKRSPVNKEKIAEYNKKYYLKVTKFKRMVKRNQNKQLNIEEVSH